MNIEYNTKYVTLNSINLLNDSCYRTKYKDGRSLLKAFLNICNNTDILFDKNIISRILLEYYYNYYYYMIDKVQNIIICVQDNPFIIFKNTKSENKIHSVNLTIDTSNLNHKKCTIDQPLASIFDRAYRKFSNNYLSFV